MRYACLFLICAVMSTFIRCSDGDGTGGPTGTKAPVPAGALTDTSNEFDLRVASTDDATFRLSSGSLDFGSIDTERSLALFNDGAAVLDWSAQPNVGWISMKPSTGSLAAGSNATLIVRVSRSGLPIGDHEGTIRFTSNAGAVGVSIKVKVASPPKLGVSPTSLDFGTTSTSLTLKVLNKGGEPLDWTAQSGASWMTLSAASGRVQGGSSQEVTVQASRATLAVGDHLASLKIGSNGGNATIPVSLTVSPDASLIVVNVRDFGAKGDGMTDDMAAFDAALSVLKSSSGGVLFVPAGVYILEPTTNGAVMLGRNYANTTIAGEGMDRSILRMAPISYQGATHVILIEKTSGITIRDLTLDGNEPAAVYNGEYQSHGIEFRSSTDFLVERVRFTRLHGDGIRLVGRYQGDEPWVERVIVRESRFENTGRGGVAMQRAVRKVRILNNSFVGISDQSLSSEPTSGGLVDVAVRDILMEGNVIQHATRPWAVALEGPSPIDVMRRIVFRNNRVENGSVSIRQGDDILIEGNTFISGATRPALEIPTNVTNLQIVDNDISGAGGNDGGGVLQVAARYNDADNAYPAHITIRNNRVRPNPGTTGILVRDALGDVTIIDNEVYGSGSRTGIDVSNPHLKLSPRTGYTVSGNTVRNFEWGIRFATGGDLFDEVVIQGNALKHNQVPPTETVGILFNKTGPYESFARVAKNVFGAGIKTTVLVK